MATLPEKDEPQPSRVTRVREAVSAPSTRLPIALATGAAIAALAPSPLDALGAAACVLVALEARKR